MVPACRRFVAVLGLTGLCLLLSSCLVDVTSITGPSSTATGKVVTFTVSGTVTSRAGGGDQKAGIVLQIPSGAQVLRAHYTTSLGISGDLSPDASIISGYIAQGGYQLYGGSGGIASTNSSDMTVTLKVWMSVPAGVTPGSYTVKAAVGVFSGSIWTPQNPQSSGSPILDFTSISGNYASSAFDVLAGSDDDTPPGDVTPVGTDDGGKITLDFTSYDEAAQGDVSKYRVHVSKATFSGISGRQLLDGTTSPSVTGLSQNYAFSGDIAGSGLFYFEVPPGAEIPIVLSGLVVNTTYYFAVTAVDVSGNESTPQVVQHNIQSGAISGTVTGDSAGLDKVLVGVYDSVNCFYVTSGLTGPDGTYTVGGLSTGSYKVAFEDNSQGHLPEWYDDQADCASAESVSVTFGQTTLNVDAELTAGGIITGTVTNGSTGLGSISVRVYNSNCSEVAFGSTDPDGSYSVGGLAAGSYKIIFLDVNGTYAFEWYAGKADCAGANSIPVIAAQTTSGVDAELAAGGSISGAVTDGSTGLESISVRVYDSNCFSQVAQSSTNPDGSYSAGGLSSGSYKIYFFSDSIIYLDEWYNEKAACDTADPVAVTAGQDTPDKNAVLTCGVQNVLSCGCPFYPCASCSLYDTIMDAYIPAALDGTFVSVHAVSFDEDLYLGNWANITLSGGFDCPFSTAFSFTTIKSLTVVGGSVTIKNFIIE